MGIFIELFLGILLEEDSRVVDRSVATFTQYKLEENKTSSILFSFAVREAQRGE
ncbi:unnamed protein product, partial [Rotaria sordida]